MQQQQENILQLMQFKKPSYLTSKSSTTTIMPVSKRACHLTRNDIAKLWMFMISMYRQIFISKHGDKDDGTWFEVLKDLTPHALFGGIERIQTLKAGLKFSEFPPNAMQFRALCLTYYDEEIKLPSMGKTFDEICDFVNSGNMRFSHPIVKYIASKLDENFYLHAIDRRYHACSNALQKVYETACHVLRQGFELPEVTLKSRHKNLTTTETARAHLRRMQKHLRGKSS